MHSRSAGLDRLLFPALVESPSRSRTAAAPSAPRSRSRGGGPPLLRARTSRARPRPGGRGSGRLRRRDLHGRTLGIVGYGDIGRQASRPARSPSGCASSACAGAARARRVIRQTRSVRLSIAFASSRRERSDVRGRRAAADPRDAPPRRQRRRSAIARRPADQRRTGRGRGRERASWTRCGGKDQGRRPRRLRGGAAAEGEPALGHGATSFCPPTRGPDRTWLEDASHPSSRTWIAFARGEPLLNARGQGGRLLISGPPAPPTSSA